MPNRKWVKPSELQIGMKVQTPDGHLAYTIAAAPALIEDSKRWAVKVLWADGGTTIRYWEADEPRIPVMED